MTIFNNPIEEMMSDFDPTNPNADHGDLVRTGGDLALNAVTQGSAGNTFSQASQAVEDLNEYTDNAFTAESIGEAAENLFGGLF